MKFNEVHFKKLVSIGLIDEGWAGFNLHNYIEQTVPDHLISNDIKNKIPSKKVNRRELFHLIKNEFDSIISCAAILAWGGKHRSHARRFISLSSQWLPVIDEIKNQNIPRSEAYKSLARLREQGHLEGVGPAFFTKFIYFFSENKTNRGYIMDQWTAKSANILISDQEQIIIDRYTQTVSDKNTEKNYEVFCNFIEELSQKLSSEWKINVTPDQAELCIFSLGEQKIKEDDDELNMRREWRRYLKKIN
jgi:hypothetical protein